MKTIDLTNGIILVVYCGYKPNDNVTAIECSQLQKCPGCGDPFCYFDCDDSKNSNNTETQGQARERIENNCRLEGIMSLLQNLYCYGFDVESMKEAIDNTINDMGNQT
jgi:hypothetical protein